MRYLDDLHRERSEDTRDLISHYLGMYSSSYQLKTVNKSLCQHLLFQSSADIIERKVSTQSQITTLFDSQLYMDINVWHRCNIIFVSLHVFQKTHDHFLSFLCNNNDFRTKIFFDKKRTKKMRKSWKRGCFSRIFEKKFQLIFMRSEIIKILINIVPRVLLDIIGRDFHIRNSNSRGVLFSNSPIKHGYMCRFSAFCIVVIFITPRNLLGSRKSLI